MAMSDPRNGTRPENQQQREEVATGDSTQATSQGDSSVLQAGEKGRSRSKPPALQSVGGLLRRVYTGKPKRLNANKAEIAVLRSTPKLEPLEREELLHVSASDRTLERTRELMLFSKERFDSPILAGQVREFIREVLRRHPVFLTESLAGVLENLPGAANEDDAVRTLTSLQYATLPWPEGFSPLKRKEAERCRMNALCCLLLWFLDTRGATIEQIRRYMESSIWAPAASKHKTDLRRLRVLMTSRDPTGIAVACSLLEKQVLEKTQQAVVARTAEERATMHAKHLEDELAGVRAQLVESIAQGKRLIEELNSARTAHDNERAHMRSDYEELRGRVLRRLRDELSLLDEGLHALQRDPPKVHVMLDHAERAIDGLKREMDRLKGDD